MIRSRYFPIWPIWAVPLLVAFSIGTVWLRLHMVKTSYEIDQTSKMIRNINKELESYELKLAHLRSPRNLKEMAKKFELQPPNTEQVIFLNRGADKR